MNRRSPSRIYLLRHARSAWAQPGERDFDRPLDEEGFAEAEILADRAVDLGYRPVRIVSSTALRCRQTAEAMRRALDHDLELLFADELYNASYDVYLEMIASTNDAESLMFIGHNPTIEEVLERLAGSDRTAAAIPTGYPTAGLAVLDRPQGSDGRYWDIVDFLTA
ncbi:histidine phosphatase family protein [Pseudorhizobium endolithicum]|uniref:Histidine phosphatase family protein n=1 Tax=Pseudorhizobium endolithicum TaxID=1191678 RepID=A0ABN7JSS4_9HYPH|nr:histidine phosphatase family protein [Pseudorhizobium endolithicum]CAD7045330.1 histidine phosphatase family protein [Pseudorhizobium endolithicum]